MGEQPLGGKKNSSRELYSETESSGLGSLKSHNNTENKSQVARDIDGILVSLKKLDHQMKHLWSMVGQEKSSNNSGKTNGPSLLAPLIHPMSPHALAQLSLMAKVENPMNPTITSNDLMASRYSLGPQYFTAGNPNNIFTNFPVNSARPLPELDEHVRNLKNRRDQIMKEHFQQSPTITTGSDLPESLLEKTKDLREWLEKF
jgi:hypothetical protein